MVSSCAFLEQGKPAQGSKSQLSRLHACYTTQAANEINCHRATHVSNADW